MFVLPNYSRRMKRHRTRITVKLYDIPMDSCMHSKKVLRALAIEKTVMMGSATAHIA